MIGALLSTTARTPGSPGGGSLAEFLLYLGVAMVAVIGAGIAVMVYRRRVLGADATDARARMLDELRAMRDRGEMTPEEYDAARRAAIGAPAPGKAREPRAPARPVAGPPPADRIARPGFDLTGAPLPGPPDDSPGA